MIGTHCNGLFSTDAGCFAQSIFNNMTDHVAILDDQGEIVAVNRAWLRFAEDHGLPAAQYGVGCNYLAVCQEAHGDFADEAVHVADGISRLLCDRQGEFQCEYPCHDDTEERWFQVRGSCFQRDDQTYLIISHHNVTSIRKMAETVVKAEVRYRALFEHSLDAVLLTCPDGRINAANAAACALFGRTEDELCALGRERVIDVADPRLSGALEERARTGKMSTELTHIKSNGVKFPALVSSVIMDGGAWSFVIINDLTEQKQKEQELRRKEEQYRTLVENQREIICRFQPDGTLTYVNARCCELAGKSADELLGTVFFQYLPEHSRQHKRDFVANMVAESQIGQVWRSVQQGSLKSDRPLWLEWETYPLAGQDGRVMEFQSVGRDITDRKEAELALESHTAFLATLLETIPNPIFFKDRQKRYLGGNRAFAEFIGIPVAEFVGKTVFDIVAPELADLYDASDQRLLTSARCDRYECQVQRADGSLRDVIFTKATFPDATDEVAGIVGAMTDITDLKRKAVELEQARRQAEAANRAKSEFLATMSHELRTPLNAILGNDEILMEELVGPLNPEQQTLARTINESGRHLLALINDILDLVRIEAGTLSLNIEPVKLSEVSDACLQLIREQAHRKGVRIISSLGQSPEYIRTDPLRLKQILVNLLTNAVKFTLSGGELELAVSKDNRNQLCFTVRDTGIGIAAEDQHKLFQPFSQVDSSLNRTYEGVGLGLAVTARLTKLLGGEIAVESEPGRGSRFTVSFSCQDSVADTPQPPTLDSHDIVTPTLPASSLILVADDSPTNSKMVAGYLTLKGYQTLIAASGAEAVALARAQRPDVVIMDIQMPGMNGLEAMAAIRNFPAPDNACIIIALTALAMPGDRERCLGAGADDYMTKPVRLRDLSDTIARFLSRLTERRAP